MPDEHSPTAALASRALAAALAPAEEPATPEPLPATPLRSGNESAELRRRIWVDEQKQGIRTPWVPVGLDWRFEHIEETWQAAEIGNLDPLARMVEAMRHEGTIGGLMAVRTSMVRLPMTFQGDPWLCSILRGEPHLYDQFGRVVKRGKRGVFRKMFPTATLIDLLYTGILAGVAVGEFVDDPVTGLPVLHIRDLHRLRYDWGERCWKYRGQKDEYLVEPGNGRWVVWMPESTHRPWRSGRWLPLALAFVVMLTTIYDRSRYAGRNADPLKWVEAPDEVPPDEVNKLEEFVQYWWERSPGLVLRYGAKAGIAELQGRGWEIYRDQCDWAEKQINFALRGNTVTGSGRGGLTDGGDLFRDIAENLIEASAESLAECLTMQGIAPWAWRFYRTVADDAPTCSWDTRSPQRRLAEAKAAGEVADNILKLDEVYAPRGRRVNADAYFLQAGFTVPTEALPADPPALPGAQATEGDDVGSNVLPESSGPVGLLPEAGTVDDVPDLTTPAGVLE